MAVAYNVFMWEPGKKQEPHIALSVAFVSDPEKPEMTGVTASFDLEALQDRSQFLAICNEMYENVRRNYLPLNAQEILAAFDDHGFKRTKLKQ